MTLFANLRAKWTQEPLRNYESVYARRTDIAAEQLSRLNAAWCESLVRSPWARALQQRLALPRHFRDWQAFKQLVPVQCKADLRAVLASPVGKVPRVWWRSTGGTTAEPLRFPILPSETKAAALDLWLGRRRLGIAPQDRLFMIWGHSHLLGSGLRGGVAKLRRLALDRVLGYTRWNAYNLSCEELRRAADALLVSRARYVSGYSSALDRFARANMDRSAEIRRLNLVAVIATAEGFPRADSREVVAACFGCHVVMEYGSVETGPIAYERPRGGYDVFWAHHRLEVVRESANVEKGELIVTSLTPRALPLLRYAIGDFVQTGNQRRDSLTTFRRVLGRCNDAIVLPNGSVIHSEAFTHAVRDVKALRAYQIVTCGDALPFIRWEAAAPPSKDVAEAIRRRLARVDPALLGVQFEWTDAIPPTLAGKHRMVVEASN